MASNRRYIARERPALHCRRRRRWFCCDVCSSNVLISSADDETRRRCFDDNANLFPQPPWYILRRLVSVEMGSGYSMIYVVL